VIDGLVEELIGFPRHLSIHSCGFTLSALPIIDTVPVEPARMDGRTIVQFDKHDLDTLGLIKIDVLALGFLSALHKACDAIGIRMDDILIADWNALVCQRCTVLKIHSHGCLKLLTCARRRTSLKRALRNINREERSIGTNIKRLRLREVFLCSFTLRGSPMVA
jgi:hypothetical protein